MKLFGLIVFCIFVSIEAAENSNAGSSLDECLNAMNSTGKSSFRTYSSDGINEQFHRVLEETIETDDVANTELVFKNCAHHIDSFEHLGATFKPNDWMINFAAEHGAEKIVRMLIDNHVNVNALDSHNYNITPLHWAARRSGSLRREPNPKSPQYVNIAKMLIAANANVSADNNEFGHTPLHEAAKIGGMEVAKILLEKGVDVNANGKDGWTPLHAAGEFNKADMTKLLLENGAQIEAKYKKGVTPLIFAASCGTKDVVKVLVDNKANINAQDDNGNTALHSIAKYRKSNNSYYVDVIRLLIENNADKNIRNNEGKTACDIAKETAKTLLIPALGCEA